MPVIDQAFTNALRAIRGDAPEYPPEARHQERDNVAACIAYLDELEDELNRAGLLPRGTATELQARIEMRVNELRELIKTGKVTL